MQRGQLEALRIRPSRFRMGTACLSVPLGIPALVWHLTHPGSGVCWAA